MQDAEPWRRYSTKTLPHPSYHLRTSCRRCCPCYQIRLRSSVRLWKEGSRCALEVGIAGVKDRFAPCMLEAFMTIKKSGRPIAHTNQGGYRGSGEQDGAKG